MPAEWEIVRDEEVTSANTLWIRRNRLEIRTPQSLTEAETVGIVRFTYSDWERAASDVSRRTAMTKQYLLKGIPPFLAFDPLTVQTENINGIPVTAFTTTIWVFPGVSIPAGALLGRSGAVVDIIYGNLDDVWGIASHILGS